MRRSPIELFNFSSSELRLEEWHNEELVWNFREIYDDKYEFFIDIMRYHNDGLRITISSPEIESRPSIIYNITVINNDLSKNIYRKFCRNSITSTSEDFIINTSLTEENGFVFKDIVRIRIRFTGFPSSLTPKREYGSNPVSPIRPPPAQKSHQPITLSQRPIINLLDIDQGSDSRSETQFVGIYNQGATCYLNAALQVLYHIPVFRGLVYSADTSNPIIGSLQRLFAAMQESGMPQRTVKLTKSFGWDQEQTAIQHDVHEFLTVFLSVIKKPLGQRLSQIFEGTQISFIRCRNVPINKEILEPFFILTLDLSGNLESALEQYTKRQIVTYSDVISGQQEAEAGIDIVSFPSVLFIHLKRIKFGEYGREKCYDRFEYPQRIDMSKFTNTDSKESDVFRLHGVIVHSGGPDRGHYYAYVAIGKKFYRFNDSDVKEVNEEDVFENSFGGELRSHCAYMLFYVRESVEEGLFAPLPNSQIPECVRYHPPAAKVKNDPDTVPISIVTNDGLSNCASRGLLSYIHPTVILEIPKNGTIRTVFEYTREKLNMPKVRLFGLVYDSYISAEVDPNSKSPLNTLFRFKALFAAEVEGNYFVPVFVYDPSLSDPLRLLHIAAIPNKSPIEDLFPEASHLLGNEGGRFKVWAAKNKSDCVYIANPRESFKLNAVMCGAAIVLEADGWSPRLSNRLRVPLFSKSDAERFTYFSRFKRRFPSDFARFIRFRFQCEHINISTAGGRKQIIYVPPLLRASKAFEFIALALGLDFDPKTDTMLLFAGQSQSPLHLKDDDVIMDALSVARSRNLFVLVQKSVISLSPTLVRVMLRVTSKMEVVMEEFPLLLDENMTAADILKIASKKRWIPDGRRVLLLREPEMGVLTVIKENEKVTDMGLSARVDICPQGMPLRSDRDDYVTVIVAPPASSGSKTPLRRQLAVVDLHETCAGVRYQIEASIGRSIRGLKVTVASAKKPESRRAVSENECLCDLMDPLFHYIIIETSNDALTIYSP